jgi:hypothetical protein
MITRVTPHSLRRRLTSRSDVKRGLPRGRSHNEWGFSNRMLDTTVALINAK